MQKVHTKKITVQRTNVCTTDPFSCHHLVTKIIFNYHIIAEKYLMLKQGLKTMLNLFEPVQYLSSFSFSLDLMHFIQFRPSGASFPGFFAI